MINLEHKILKACLSNERYCRTVLPHLNRAYFEGGSRLVFTVFIDYVSKYNRLPTPDVLKIDFAASPLVSDPKRNEFFESLNDIAKTSVDENEEEWLVKTTEKWCREKAIHNALMESISIIDGKNKDLSEGAIPDILSKALAVSFDKSVGHDYLENAEMRFEEYHRKETKIPFDLECFNDITDGGLSRKTLTMILAGTGCGKTLAMCHIAAGALSQGYNVLYVTMEMSEYKIAERIDANLLDIAINDLQNLDRDTFIDSVARVSKKTQGKLVIKEYPTAAANVNHFRALLEELKMKKDFTPDMIVIDYLNICASSRMKGMGGAINSYSYIKAIAEEVRGLAVESNSVMISATQTNREGFGDTDVSITNTSDSFGVPATCDVMVALVKTEELDREGKILVKQLKNRYQDMNKKLRFMVGFEGDRMRLYDLDDPTKGIMKPVQHVADVDDKKKQSPFVANMRKTVDITGLKV